MKLFLLLALLSCERAPGYSYSDIDDLRAQERALRALVTAQLDEVRLFCIHLQGVLLANETARRDPINGETAQTLFSLELVENMCMSLEGLP